MKKVIIVTLFLIAVNFSEAFSQAYVVVVNTSNNVASLTKKELSDIFLKKKTKWENGSTIVPVDLVPGSSVRDNFSTQIHGKNVAAIRSFWQQAVFSGNATAPVEKSNDTEVMEYVKKNAGAIGYISSASVNAGVKQVSLK
jgi:ABC-type phosphate transport system substrate-binding protein